MQENIVKHLNDVMNANTNIICVGLGKDLGLNDQIQDYYKKFASENNKFVVFVETLEEAYIDKKVKKINPNLKKEVILDIKTIIGSLNLKPNDYKEFSKEKNTIFNNEEKISKTHRYLELIYNILNFIKDSIDNKEKNGKSYCYIITNSPERVLLGLSFFDLILKKAYKNSKNTEKTLELTYKMTENICIMRGSIKLPDFYICLTNILNFLKNDLYDDVKILRINLLETIEKKQFFLGPMSLNIVSTVGRKREMIMHVYELMFLLKTRLSIAIMTGGSFDRSYNNVFIKKSVDEAKLLMEHFRNEVSKDIMIVNGEVFLKKAILDDANFIMAPDALNANFISRTLINLGGGKSYGVLYLDLLLKYQKLIVDTVTDNNIQEHENALIQAIGFKNRLIFDSLDDHLK